MLLPDKQQESAQFSPGIKKNASKEDHVIYMQEFLYM